MREFFILRIFRDTSRLLKVVFRLIGQTFRSSASRAFTSERYGGCVIFYLSGARIFHFKNIFRYQKSSDGDV